MSRAVVTSLVCCLHASAAGQSVNLDYGLAAATPDPTYQAAGVAGQWNGLNAPTGVPQPLVGLRGQATKATVTHDFGAYLGLDDPGTSGNDQALLDDGLGDLGDVMCNLTFEGLVDGAYEVIAYAWTPGQPGDSTLVVVNNDVGEIHLSGGAWPGHFEPGVTHIVQEAEVDGGTLTVGVVGGFFGASGFLNGVQLRRLTPADLDDDGIVGIEDLLMLIGAWGPCKAPPDCPADLDGDEAVGIHDLLVLLGEWG
jgi:hypothetical protein